MKCSASFLKKIILVLSSIFLLASCAKKEVSNIKDSYLENQKSFKNSSLQSMESFNQSEKIINPEVSKIEYVFSQMSERFKSEVKISAKTQEGFSELYKKIRDSFAQNLSTDRNQAGLGSARQKKSVEEALEAIQHAIKTSGDYALDAVVQDLEDSLDALSEITGEICADDILSSIFSNFCVGK